MTQNKTNCICADGFGMNLSCPVHSAKRETPVAQSASSSTGQMKHTLGPWHNGIGPDGITGPNTPTYRGPTCGEQCEWNDWFRIKDNKTPEPESKHICITVGQDTLAIVVGPNRYANARLIAEAGTVATETGLTPRQLADQRAEYKWAFEALLDAHYGTAFHHIGDGDGIPKEDADRIRELISGSRK